MTPIAGNELLQGERIRLTRVTPEDIEIYTKWFYEDIGMLRNLGFSPAFPRSLEDEKEWIQDAMNASDIFTYSIQTRENNQTIGNVSLMRIDWQARSAEVGIVIANPDFRGKGYGTDTMRVIVRVGFMEFGLNRIWLRVFSYNPRGIRAYEKAGFTHEGIIRQHMARDQRYHDTHIMSILRREWQAINDQENNAT